MFRKVMLLVTLMLSMLFMNPKPVAQAEEEPIYIHPRSTSYVQFLPSEQSTTTIPPTTTTQPTTTTTIATKHTEQRKANASVHVSTASGNVWDRLAQCESGGNWSINTGNGFYGGLQFDHSTWLNNGGGQYAAYAHQASREQQIAIAEVVRAARGYYPWPACARKLGLI